MSETWSIEKLQRLCELAKAEAAKKDKTLKRPGKEAGVDEKYAYLEKIHYTELLKEEILARAQERLEKLCKSGSDAQNKYGDALELLREGIRALQNGGMGIGSAELNELRNEAATNLNALQAGYPEKTGKELLVILGNDRNQERYFYILRPDEMMKGESSELFSREYIDNIRNLYLKEKTNYEKVVEELENCIKEEKGRSASLKSESEFALFLNAFKAYEEVEQGKQKLNKENCSEFLHEMENRLLKPIQEAESGSGLKQAMLLAFRYPECLERFCVIRNLEELNKAVEYKKEITEQLTAQMIQQSPGLTRKMIAQIAAGLNIKLAETETGNNRREEAENQYRPQPRVSTENLALVHTYIMKEMPDYIAGVKPYYNALLRMAKEGVYQDFVSNLQELKSIQDNFWNRYNRWVERRKLLSDIDLSGSEETMRQMAAGDRQMQEMAESMKESGKLLEQSFYAFLTPKYEKLEKYDRELQKIASEISACIDAIKGINQGGELLSGKEKKKKEEALRQYGDTLKQLLEEMRSEKKEWEKAGKAADTVRNRLKELIKKAEEWQQEAVSQAERNKDRRFFKKVSIVFIGIVAVLVGIWLTKSDSSPFPRTEELAEYNRIMDNPTLEELASYFPDTVDLNAITDIQSDGEKDIKWSDINIFEYCKGRNSKINNPVGTTYGRHIIFVYEVAGVKYLRSQFMNLADWIEIKRNRPEADLHRHYLWMSGKKTNQSIAQIPNYSGRVLEGTYIDETNYDNNTMRFVFGATPDGINYSGSYVLWEDGSVSPCTENYITYNADSSYQELVVHFTIGETSDRGSDTFDFVQDSETGAFMDYTAKNYIIMEGLYLRTE